MKNEPWVRLGIRISPKISENPAERRKSSPPKVMLLTERTSHRFMDALPRLVFPGGASSSAADSPANRPAARDTAFRFAGHKCCRLHFRGDRNAAGPAASR